MVLYTPLTIPNISGIAKVKMLSIWKTTATTQMMASATQVVTEVISERAKLWLMDRLTRSTSGMRLPYRALFSRTRS